jgi:hypothetical protein
MYLIFLRAEILGLDLAKVFTMIGFNGLFFEFNCADMKFNINFLYRFLPFHGDWIRAYKLGLYTWINVRMESAYKCDSLIKFIFEK